MASRYSLILTPSPGPSVRSSRVTFSITESRMLRFFPIRARRAAGSRAAAVAEQPFEHRARIVFHRQRRGRAAPRDRVGVGAAEADVARPGLPRFERELERGELRLLAELRRHHLVDRDAGVTGRSPASASACMSGQELRAARARDTPLECGPPALLSPLNTSRRSRNGVERLQNRRELERRRLRPPASSVPSSMPFGT